MCCAGRLLNRECDDVMAYHGKCITQALRINPRPCLLYDTRIPAYLSTGTPVSSGLFGISSSDTGSSGLSGAIILSTGAAKYVDSGSRSSILDILLRQKNGLCAYELQGRR